MIAIKLIPIEGTNFSMPLCADCGRMVIYRGKEPHCHYCELTAMCDCRRNLKHEPHTCFYTMIAGRA